MRRITLFLISVQLLLISAAARAQDPLADATPALASWVQKLGDGREVVDRVVVCFDEASVLREISKWDAKRRWPVLLWESDLVPKFIAAFEPEQVLLAEYAKDGAITLESGLDAVASAWHDGTVARDEARDVLAARKKAPMGIVLLSGDSPELLGGIALAAGRMHLPIPFDVPETHAKRVSFERKEELRRRLATVATELGAPFARRLDDLDFVTVANDLPFAYTLSDPDAHPGAYTIDDAIARNDDLTRWGWVGRLTGGPARSVYMAMGALFLQPKSGLFFSRYDPKNTVFGAYDPAPALETFRRFFPTEAIRHPDATLAKWREVQWPRGNQAGFVFVNSSGGATSWSTSKGGATHFDVPDTVPTVVHYTHSGSAGRPFDVDSIAGRWLANGAYVYFGSHAEPYLQSFVSARDLAARVKAGVPLGAAMRQLYTTALGGRRTMKVGGVDKSVTFNMSGPWKLAYFGDPSYRLTAYRGPRVKPESLSSRGYYSSVRKFKVARRRTDAEKTAHLLAGIGIVRLDPSAKRLVDVRTWSRLLKALPAGAESAALDELMRLWVEDLRRAGDGARPGAVPSAIEKLAESGANAAEASRRFSEFAKAAVAAPLDPKIAGAALETACCFVPSKGAGKPFFAWVKEAAKALGIDVKDLRAAVAKTKWATEEARKAAEAGLK